MLVFYPKELKLCNRSLALKIIQLTLNNNQCCARCHLFTCLLLFHALAIGFAQSDSIQGYRLIDVGT